MNFKTMATKRRRKTKKKPVITMGRLMLLIVAALIYFGYRTMTGETKNNKGYVSFPTGDLTYVATRPDTPETMVRYKGMDISFNPRMHIPNWVSWELTADETEGAEPRYNKFSCDENVPGCPDHYDYNYSGYDRGHMAPAGDMKWDQQAMRETFYMTNICPQVKSFNTGTWKRLEDKCRVWARADSAIVIVCGPVLTDSITEFIGDSRVAVPKRFFKVIAAPYAKPPRGIGFIMANGKVHGGMQSAAVSIDEVERITGHDFFSSLPDDIEADIESQNDFHYWSTIR